MKHLHTDFLGLPRELFNLMNMQYYITVPLSKPVRAGTMSCRLEWQFATRFWTKQSVGRGILLCKHS